MLRSLLRALSLGFQRALASTEVQGLQPLNPLLCLIGPLRCSHPYMAIHTAGACGLKAAGEAGSVTGPQSVSRAFSGHGMSFSSLPLADEVPPVEVGEVLVEEREERRENRNSRESAEKKRKKKERKEGRSELGEMMGGRERLEEERGSPNTGEERQRGRK
ncbi:hypothetical protein BTVI_19685 [Pitangus sulphuratus]|nr:hypothetical protein BTVI_19685 [Pitangus sulphuratus]